MTAFSEFMKNNREMAYAIVTANTPTNLDGRPIIVKDDEWRNETEWDTLYAELKE